MYRDQISNLGLYILLFDVRDPTSVFAARTHFSIRKNSSFNLPQTFLKLIQLKKFDTFYCFPYAVFMV